MIAIRTKIKFARGRSGRRRMVPKPPEPTVVSDGWVPRISKLMALAIRFEGLIREGQVTVQNSAACPRDLAMSSNPRARVISSARRMRGFDTVTSESSARLWQYPESFTACMASRMRRFRLVC